MGGPREVTFYCTGISIPLRIHTISSFWLTRPSALCNWCHALLWFIRPTEECWRYGQGSSWKAEQCSSLNRDVLSTQLTGNFLKFVRLPTILRKLIFRFLFSTVFLKTVLYGNSSADVSTYTFTTVPSHIFLLYLDSYHEQ